MAGAAAGMLLAACIDLTGPLPGQAPTCVVDADCDGAQVCDVPTGSCVAAVVTDPVEVVFQILGSSGPEGLSPPRLSLEPRTLSDATSQQTLVLPGVALALGTLRVDEEVVAADLRFTREGDVEPFEQRTVAAETSTRLVDGEAVDFAVALLADETYTLEVLPRPSLDATGTPWSRRLPPRRFEGLRLPGRGEVLRLPLVYPEGLDAPCGPGRATRCRLEGVVLEEADDGGRGPLAGLSVRASSRVDGALVSSVAVTDDEGRFAIVISPDAEPDYLLRIAATESGTLVPTTTVDPAFLVPGESLEVLAPRPRELLYGGTVFLPNSMFAQDALLELTSTSLVDDTFGPPAFFESSPVPVQSDGSFEARILAGEYRVVITPSSADAGAAVHVEELVLAPEDGVTELLGQGFELQTRSRFTGQINASSIGFGEPVPILAVPRAGSTPLERAARDVQTTGSSGTYELRLDVGVYDLFFQPDPATGRPWQIVPDLRVERTGDRVQNFDIELPAPLRVDGQVQNPGGEACVPAADAELAPPCAGAQVRALVRLPGRDRFVLLAETRSDPGGAFTLLLPSRLPEPD